jgi:hypothetical protein
MPDENDDGTYGIGSGLSFRLASAERALIEHEKILDDLRQARILHSEQLSTLKEQHKRNDLEIDKINDSREPMLAILNARMSRIDTTLDEKIDTIKDDMSKSLDILAEKFEKNVAGVSEKLESFTASNQTMLIGIFIAIISTLVFVIAAKVL